MINSRKLICVSIQDENKLKLSKIKSGHCWEFSPGGTLFDPIFPSENLNETPKGVQSELVRALFVLKEEQPEGSPR